MPKFFSKLRQVGAVREHQSGFRRQLRRAGKLTTDQQTGACISDLKGTLCVEGRTNEPMTLLKVIGLARLNKDWGHKRKKLSLIDPDFEASEKSARRVKEWVVKRYVKPASMLSVGLRKRLRAKVDFFSTARRGVWGCSRCQVSEAIRHHYVGFQKKIAYGILVEWRNGGAQRVPRASKQACERHQFASTVEEDEKGCVLHLNRGTLQSPLIQAQSSYGESARLVEEHEEIFEEPERLHQKRVQDHQIPLLSPVPVWSTSNHIAIHSRKNEMETI
ncbi:hypothetical protein Nepgr_032702 [Nepenthes gracilis]|uniref:Uncharacterized protein n=1 Tax=Nepenthes gracilis TaxID=150966 RepID=A0AAD3TKK5_NEPGR|nr:hypothetical protein Nepgr_032702 [Nepenthes gracilis]